MTLNLSRSTEESKMEQKEKQNQKSPELIVAEQQVKLLQEQLTKLSSDQADLALQKEAEKMAKEEAALKAETDLRKTLGEEFSAVKAELKAGEEISPEQMIAIMGEAVEASSDAQAKLILKKVETMQGASNAELKKTQQLLFELAAGMSMNQTRSDHSDYDDYKTEIAGIMSTTRGLSPEDAYILAKAKKKGDNPDQRQTESERPGNIPMETALSSRNQYVQEKTDDGVRRSPKAVFKSAAEAAVEKLMKEKQGR